MARIQHYDQGDLWRPTATFVVGGTPTDPTTITVKVREPDGTVVAHGPVAGTTGGGEITRVSAGVFRIDVDLDAAGYWYAHFQGTGAATASEEHKAIVDPSMFFADGELMEHALVTLDEAREWLQQQNVDTANDLELARVINDISERFSEEAGREFKVVGENPQVRTFWVDAAGYSTGVVRVGDMADAPTLVRILGNDWTSVVNVPALGSIRLEPQPRRSWQPITRLVFNRLISGNLRHGALVEVTGDFGFPSIPGNVRQAVLDAVAATLDRDAEHYTLDQGGSGQTGDASTVSYSFKPMMISLPIGPMAVARSYADPLVA